MDRQNNSSMDEWPVRKDRVVRAGEKWSIWEKTKPGL